MELRQDSSSLDEVIKVKLLNSHVSLSFLHGFLTDYTVSILTIPLPEGTRVHRTPPATAESGADEGTPGTKKLRLN